MKSPEIREDGREVPLNHRGSENEIASDTKLTHCRRECSRNQIGDARGPARVLRRP